MPSLQKPCYWTIKCIKYNSFGDFKNIVVLHILHNYRLGEELGGIYEDHVDNETSIFEDEGI